jgi:hypothetical protein
MIPNPSLNREISPEYPNEDRIRFFDARVGYLLEGVGWRCLDHSSCRRQSGGQIIDLPVQAWAKGSSGTDNHSCGSASTIHCARGDFNLGQDQRHVGYNFPELDGGLGTHHLAGRQFWH